MRFATSANDPIPCSQDSAAIVRRFLTAAETRDLPTLRELADPGIRVVEAESLPFGGVCVGLDAFLDLARRVFRTLRVTDLCVDRMIAQGDFVVLLARLQGRAADDSPFEMSLVETWELHDGRVIEVRPYYQDTHALVSLLGSPKAEFAGIPDTGSA